MATPTLNELTTQVRQDLAAEGVTQVWIRRTFEAALAIVLAGVLWMFYRWIDALVKQCVPSTATGTYLDLWAGVFGLTRTAAATAAGQAVINGITGSTQPAGSILVGPDGQEYMTDADVTMVGNPGEIGAGYISVTATGPGDEYNLPVGAPLVVSSPAPGIQSHALAGFLGIAGGKTAETDDDLRARLLARIRRPAEVGTSEDFRRWTREAHESVSRVWVYECGRLGNEAGKVLVMFAVAGPSPIPQAGDVTAVWNHLQTKRPAGMLWFDVLAPTDQSTDLTIALDPSRDNASTRAAVTGFLRDLFLAGAPGVSIANLDLRAATSRAGVAFQLQSVAGGPGTADVVAASPYHLPILGTITWGTWQ